MTEQWKDVSEAPRYRISNLGRIYSKITNDYKKPVKDKKGYMRVQVYVDGKPLTKKLHRLVAQHFIDNPRNLPQVNHINCDKTDNRVDNLEWCTNEQNMAHAKANNVHAKRTDIEKLVPQIATAIDKGYMIGDIALYLNTSVSVLHAAMSRQEFAKAPITTLRVGRRKTYYYYDQSRSKWRAELRRFGMRSKQFNTEEEVKAYIERNVYK